MRIVCMSDTHGFHEDVHVPEGDVLVHAGDCTRDIGKNDLRQFLVWLRGLPHKHKIFIAGNHDGAFEKWNTEARHMVSEIGGPSVIYLQEEAVKIEGIKFYGMPHTPAFCNWFFNVPRDLMFVHCNRIPNDTDVLITHGPPHGPHKLDISGFDKSKVGCRALWDAFNRVQPTLHVFGHIHHSYGSEKFVHDLGNKSTLINASICDEGYRPTRKPFIFEV